MRNLNDDLRPGKTELRIRLREGAFGLGLDADNVARQLRVAFQGSKADEIQVGPESYEIDVQLRPTDQNTLADLETFYFTGPAGEQIPLATVAEVWQDRGWSRIARIDGLRTVTVRGGVDTRKANTADLLRRLRRDFLPELQEKYPDLRFEFEGQSKEAATTQQSMMRAMLVGLLGVFAILSFQFRSYLEPLTVMIAIPLALIGVIWGHLLMGVDFSMPSMLGYASLAGVVVNDSILLVLFLKAERDRRARRAGGLRPGQPHAFPRDPAHVADHDRRPAAAALGAQPAGAGADSAGGQYRVRTDGVDGPRAVRHPVPVRDPGRPRLGHHNRQLRACALDGTYPKPQDRNKSLPPALLFLSGLTTEEVENGKMSYQQHSLCAIALLCASLLNLLAAGEPLDGLVQHGYAMNGDVRLHFVAAGEGPLVIMLHGFPDYWYSWRHQIEELSKTHRVVAMDLRGYNLSDQPEDVSDYVMLALVSDVVAVLDHLGEKNAFVVGNDWGGAIAWLMAAFEPQRVKGLIVCNLPHPTCFSRELRENPRQKEASQYAKAFCEEGAGQRLTPEALVEIVAKDREEEVRAHYLEAFRRSSITGMLNYYRAAFPKSDAVAHLRSLILPRIKCPTLVIHGLKDKALLASGLNNTWDYVDAELTIVTLPQAGHFVHQDAPEKANQLIGDWLGQVDPDG